MSAAQEPDVLPLRKVLVVAFVTAVVFGIGIAAAGVRIAGHDLTSVAPPRGTVETSLIWDTARGLDGRDAGGLTRWGWVDRDAGIARIPIDRAIDVTLEERK